MEVSVCNISINRRSNLAPLDQISKSGDSGRSGDILDTLPTSTEVHLRDYDVNDNRPFNNEYQRDIETKNRSIYRLKYSNICGCGRCSRIKQGGYRIEKRNNYCYYFQEQHPKSTIMNI